MSSSLTLEITYSNGDMLRKTVPYTEVLAACSIDSMFTGMATYIQQNYPDAQNYFIYYQGSMLFSKTHSDSLQELFTKMTE